MTHPRSWLRRRCRLCKSPALISVSDAPFCAGCACRFGMTYPRSIHRAARKAVRCAIKPCDAEAETIFGARPACKACSDRNTAFVASVTVAA